MSRAVEEGVELPDFDFQSMKIGDVVKFPDVKSSEEKVAKSDQPRHPKGSSKGGQFASSKTGRTVTIDSHDDTSFRMSVTEDLTIGDITMPVSIGSIRVNNRDGAWRIDNIVSERPGLGTALVQDARSSIGSPLRTSRVFSDKGKKFFESLTSRGIASRVEDGNDYEV